MKTKIIMLLLSILSVSTSAQDKYWETSTYLNCCANAEKLFMLTDSTYHMFGEFRDNAGNGKVKGYNLVINKLGVQENVNIIEKDTLEIYIHDTIKDGENYVTIGTLTNLPFGDLRTMYFIKTNANGEEIFSTVTGSNEYKCSPRAITPTSDGNYLIGGFINPIWEYPYTKELYLIKVDSLGNMLWEQTYLEDEYFFDCGIGDILPAEEGGYYLLSVVDHVDENLGDVLIIKIDEEGTIEWIETYDFGAEDQCGHIYQTVDGGYVMSCTLDDGIKMSNVVKLDSGFNIVWEAKDNFPLCNSNITIPVGTSSQISAGCNNTLTEYGAQMRIVKTDSLGEVMWFRDYGGLGHDYGYDIIHAPDGGFVISGRTESYPLDTASIYLVKVNCMGLLTEPDAQFSYTQSDFSFDFMNESQYVYPDSIDGGHYFWDFGDGATSEELNPTHTYPEIGIYGASLTGIVCNDTSIYRQILCVGAEAISTPNFSVNSDDGTLHYFENESILPNNFSLDYAHYTWDFGDGDSSTAIHPIHVYTESGSYTVTLSYTICDQVYELSTEINVSTSTELLTERTKVSIYPNPAQDQAIITYDLGDFKSAVLNLYDTQGRLVQVQPLALEATYRSINLSRLKGGLYVYEVVVDGERVGGGSLVVSP